LDRQRLLENDPKYLALFTGLKNNNFKLLMIIQTLPNKRNFCM
jgi:hypothetical protein